VSVVSLRRPPARAAVRLPPWAQSWLLPRLLLLGALLAAWELVARSGWVSRLFLVGPGEVVLAFWKLASSGRLWFDLQASLLELGLGFALGIGAAIPAGLLLGTFRRLEIALEPYLMGLYATPRVAFYPMLIAWLGFGLSSQVALLFLSTFFPICINTWSGVKTVDPVLIRAARSFGANQLQLFTKVVLPYTLPFITAGIRVALGRGLIALYVVEAFGANAGLGYLIAQAGTEYRVGDLFVGVLVLAALGVLFDGALRWAERRLAPWRPEQPL
jgi:ABC-type nitrate/sulfonate/bicarbonate transport system permease component